MREKRRELKALAVLLVTLVVGVAFVATVIGQGLGVYETVTFPSETYVIPMDGNQADRIKVFGFLHKVLREGGEILRVIEPPDITLKTTSNPGGATYQGGPVLVMTTYASAITAAQGEFPTVTVDTLTEQVTSDRVFRVGEPTDILLIYGTYGHTEQVLDNMGVPYTMVQTTDVEADPCMFSNYDLVIDDCPGWWGSVPAVQGVHGAEMGSPAPETVAECMRTFVQGGGEIIFTDIALEDLVQVFPNYVDSVSNVDGTWQFTFHNVGEFPSQWYGPTTLSIYTMGGGNIASQTLSADVRVMLDSNAYSGEYRIGAYYFPYGDGIVEGFAFHPPEQTGEAETLTSFMFGNKFVHTSAVVPTPTPTVPPEVTPTPTVPVPTPTPTVPVPTPTPTPEPFIPEANTMILLGSGLAGLAGYASMRLRAWRRKE